MIVRQEEKSPVEDFVLKYNLERVFTTIIEKAGSNEVETEELKVFCEQASGLLKSFVKYIEGVEKQEVKEAAKRKFNEIINKGASFDD